MMNYVDVVQTFPSVRIEAAGNGLPVEVSLIAQLGHGSGNALYESVLARQKQHQDFVDELDEPSVKLGGTNFAKGDLTSLYSFVVGPAGHPFHRHAGHRIFTAISGSGGAQLRFATASDEQLKHSPQAFIESLRYINIPADCLFTVRFGGTTWHQFAPIVDKSRHPVFVALSCHTNELGGIESETLKQQVIENKASIPSLTEVLPGHVLSLMLPPLFQASRVPTTTLSIDAPEGTLHRLMCAVVRGASGVLRGAAARLRSQRGYVSQSKRSEL